MIDTAQLADDVFGVPGPPATGQHVTAGRPPLDEILAAQRQVRALVQIDGADEIMTPEIQRVMNDFASMQMPSAPVLAKAAMAGAIESEQVMIVWHRARKGLYAMAPRLVELAAQKAENKSAAGDTKVILALLDGLGLINPSVPIATKKREAEIKNIDVRTLTDEDLDERLMKGMTHGE